MAQENAEQEPTMEEILASIRRIINEDEDEKPAEAAAPEPQPEPEAAAPEPEPEPEPEAEPEPAFEAEPMDEPDEDDVLELTDRVEEEPQPVSEPVSPADDLMILDREDEAPEPEPAPVPQPAVEEEDNLVDDAPASAASGMFAALSENLRVSSDQGQTLEGIVRELLRPMLKQWLDDNLPTIVEEKVQAEIERIARRRR
ncbi:DUF2497 domain-containing protein [Maricaulaceae bacterium MS644]